MGGLTLWDTDSAATRMAFFMATPELLPWAWGINGFLSVLASLLTITLSMALGFSTVLVLAAGVYVAGFASMVLYLRGPGARAAGP